MLLYVRSGGIAGLRNYRMEVHLHYTLAGHILLKETAQLRPTNTYCYMSKFRVGVRGSIIDLRLSGTNNRDMRSVMLYPQAGSEVNLV
jgi:hypothetical protein